MLTSSPSHKSMLNPSHHSQSLHAKQSHLVSYASHQFHTYKVSFVVSCPTYLHLMYQRTIIPRYACMYKLYFNSSAQWGTMTIMAWMVPSSAVSMYNGMNGGWRMQWMVMWWNNVGMLLMLLMIMCDERCRCFVVVSCDDVIYVQDVWVGYVG